MGNIRSGSQARSAAVIPENYPQTASLVSDHAASIAEYERSVVQQSEQNTRAVRPSASPALHACSSPHHSARPAEVVSGTSNPTPNPAPALAPQSILPVVAERVTSTAVTRIPSYLPSWKKRSDSATCTMKECTYMRPSCDIRISHCAQSLDRSGWTREHDGFAQSPTGVVLPSPTRVRSDWPRRRRQHNPLPVRFTRASQQK